MAQASFLVAGANPAWWSHSHVEHVEDEKVCGYSDAPVGPWSDCFQIVLSGIDAPIPFTASYQDFALFAADVDCDGIDEAFLEYGLGRGTNAHEKHLDVLRLSEPDPRLLLSAQLTGYLLVARRGDPPVWVRQYSLVKSRLHCALDVQLRLVAPKTTPTGLDDPEGAENLRIPTIRFRYSPRARAYERLKPRT